jgi:Arc/MetJ family transcription regulator
MMWIMRTTIDLPDDLHRQAMSIARDTSRTFSDTVADLVRRALSRSAAADISRSTRTGLPVVRLGAVVTTDDVRALDDEE